MSSAVQATLSDFNVTSLSDLRGLSIPEQLQFLDAMFKTHQVNASELAEHLGANVKQVYHYLKTTAYEYPKGIGKTRKSRRAAKEQQAELSSASVQIAASSASAEVVTVNQNPSAGSQLRDIQNIDLSLIDHPIFQAIISSAAQEIVGRMNHAQSIINVPNQAASGLNISFSQTATGDATSRELELYALLLRHRNDQKFKVEITIKQLEE